MALTDGYAAYQSVQKKGGAFQLAHCWSHVRRKFTKIEDTQPGKCETVLDLIGKRYEIERRAKGRPPDEVLALRLEQSRPIVLQIQNWAMETEALPQSSLGKAIAYMGGVWKGLRVFLDNPLVSLDNNATERALRGVVLGRKTTMGRSRSGAPVSRRSSTR